VQFKGTAVRTIIASRNLASAAGQATTALISATMACEIARRCQRDCPIERLVRIEIIPESGSRFFGGWHRQTDIGHCSPRWISSQGVSG
jgi:hypothetical protein